MSGRLDETETRKFKRMKRLTLEEIRRDPRRWFAHYGRVNALSPAEKEAMAEYLQETRGKS